MAAENEDVNAFDLACETQTRVSELLADDAADVMSLSGPVGRFTYIGQGTPLEYLVKPALMEALSTTIDEAVWVDEVDDVEEVQSQLERQLKEVMDPFQAEYVAQETASTLEQWSEYHDDDGDEEADS